jgi:hypothetical protein
VPTIAGHNVASYANGAGFINNDLRIAVAVAKAESGWNTSSRYITQQEDSRGLWQINTYAHPDLGKKNLYDPAINAAAARTVFRNAGNRWTPWTTYTRGTYLQYLDDADNALAGFRSLGGELGATPDPGVSGGAGAEAPPRPEPYGPYDPSVAIRGVGAWFNSVGGSLAAVGDQAIHLYRY